MPCLVIRDFSSLAGHSHSHALSSLTVRDTRHLPAKAHTRDKEGRLEKTPCCHRHLTRRLSSRTALLDRCSLCQQFSRDRYDFEDGRRPLRLARHRYVCTCVVCMTSSHFVRHCMTMAWEAESWIEIRSCKDFALPRCLGATAGLLLWICSVWRKSSLS